MKSYISGSVCNALKLNACESASQCRTDTIRFYATTSESLCQFHLRLASSISVLPGGSEPKTVNAKGACTASGPDINIS